MNLIGKPCQIHLPNITKNGFVKSEDACSYTLQSNDGATAICVGKAVVERKFAEQDPYFYAC